MISTGQDDHQQAVGISSVNVVSCLYKLLTMEIPAVTRLSHDDGKQVGPASPSAWSQIRFIITLSSNLPWKVFFCASLAAFT